MIEFVKDKSGHENHLRIVKSKKFSQVQVLAKELAKRPLTGMQIIKELGILNYKGRVYDLRQAMLWNGRHSVGYYTLITDTVSSINRSHFALYKIPYHKKSDYKKFLRDFLK